MPQLNTLSAVEIARLVRERVITSEQVVRSCIERIEARDNVVRAWVDFDPARAIEEARARDAAAAEGPLHGVPIGIKDVIDTADMPTQMGSPIYEDHEPASDASCVALLRRAGAVILGKTVTAEFAHVHPGATTNPLNPAHTPGGSSSGSAAAVADFMTPLAVGTQTGGSTLRPASFCGIVGFKPTFGRINRSGIKAAAESLDTVGLMARSIEDVELLARVLMGRVSPPRRAQTPPRIAMCRTHLWYTAFPETYTAFRELEARLREAGASVGHVSLPDDFADLNRARLVLSNRERAKAMAYEWNAHRDALSEPMRKAIAQGLRTSEDEYLATLQFTRRCSRSVSSVVDGFDVLITPTTTGEAPKGLRSTGDTRLQDIWTVLHMPALTLPTHRGPNGLPLGMQIVAPMYRDESLLETARWIWQHVQPA
jgi:amidase